MQTVNTKYRTHTTQLQDTHNTDNVKLYSNVRHDSSALNKFPCMSNHSNEWLVVRGYQ